MCIRYIFASIIASFRCVIAFCVSRMQIYVNEAFIYIDAETKGDNEEENDRGKTKETRYCDMHSHSHTHTLTQIYMCVFVCMYPTNIERR